MATYHELTEAEAAKNLAENRMLDQLPHDDWCDMAEKRGGVDGLWEFSIECACTTRDVVAKLREMGLMR